MENKKKILTVIAPKDFRDVEYSVPKEIFLRNGFEVKTASIQKILAQGADGLKVNVDLTVAEVNQNNYEAVVFIGGPGMAQIIDDESMQLLAKSFFDAGKVTAAICVAPEILAKAGILAGKSATVFPDSKSVLEAGGAVYKDEAVVVDGKLVTGNGPDAAREFGEQVAAVLAGKN